MNAKRPSGSGNVPPMVGMMAAVRNRRGVVSAVAPFGGASEPRLHLVSIEYADPDGPPEDVLVWEREAAATLLEPTALPDVFGQPPMLPEELDGLTRATRWTALAPFVDPDGAGPLTRYPVSSPFHAAIQLDDYQLVPLLKALRMPRVTLLLADDVGLGKTIQAGLIVTELIQRRRLRRVLVLCPASLRSQWADEMVDKFCLRFEMVDREATHRLRKEMGLDANPWRTFPRIIASYDYLKQPDVLESFQAACAVAAGSPHLPWDMLVVDEAHNLAPMGYGEDSQVSRMLTVLEALRLGAASVLEMERSDVQVLVTGQPGRPIVDGILYDPMPGGSGLLDQLISRFGDVHAAALNIVGNCPSGCVRACVDCLLAFENGHYQRHLDRHRAIDSLTTQGTTLVFDYPIPPHLPAPTTTREELPVNAAEQRLADMLQRAGFPDPIAQHPIALGHPFGRTVPDFFWPGEDGEPGLCLYLDGLSKHIHGNAATQKRDHDVRETLHHLGYEVLAIAASDLDDHGEMRVHFRRLAKLLLGLAEAKAIAADDRWF